jgi:UDP-N-acetylmuramate: L-alanyl-gamma-D-glutamyl-meso-diaminopimelate ligase
MADVPVVFFNREVLLHKKLPDISDEFVSSCFKNEKLRVISDKEMLVKFLLTLDLHNSVLLLMSSGNFADINLKDILN